MIFYWYYLDWKLKNEGLSMCLLSTYCLSVLRILAGCTFMVAEIDNSNYAVFKKVVDGL